MQYNLSNAEEEVLQALWDSKKWVSCNELVEHFEQTGKDWKRQTVNTFLVRLINKGFVIKNGRKYIYTYSKEEMESLKAKEIIETLYNGSLKKFISALTGKNKVDKKLAEELKAYIDEIEN